jgi:ATP-dependent RNA helicase SUPV3L1/SUV3
VLGPTNTGKTHLAIERMLAHDVGIIGLPLRLLAREVYDKIVARIGAAQVALITGEEKIKPPSPRFYVCTVEAMPLDLEADFVAVDEIQLAADGERGHVFTERLFRARGLNETLLLGAATMRDTIRELLPDANLVSRPRLSTLTYAGEKKITRLPRRSAIDAFSANDVYAIAELVRRQRGGAAVVLGALSPRTRNAQVALYQNGDVDFLVATDAIGMGLNLDLDHVAFAGLRKFDGRAHRNLTPGELGQIAGRAGRHMNDGTFGVTGQVQPFEPELIDRLENHSFDQVGVLQWRNRKLDFSSVEALKESLRVTPDHPRLMRSRMVDDVIALENVSHDPAARDLAVGPAGVALLWEMCQIPDYRKISPASHAELVGTLYRFVMSDEGRIPADWFAHQVSLADRTDGDLDTLSSRLAQIRSWTYVSHRGEWLDDPEHWQERTRAIEGTLSDALHERLTMRFVDRRTSVLMRRLRDKEDLIADIDKEGRVMVEDHYVGRLDGFRFTPDADGGDGINGRATRHAASKVLATELANRARALAEASDADIALKANGRIVWAGSEIARLERGETPLKPRLQFFADEHLGAAERERATRRLEAWLATELGLKLQPLLSLSESSDLSGLARGLAFRLAESFGVLRRDSIAGELKLLEQAERAKLRKHGVRFGAFNIHIPSLLKPAAADLLLLLWALYAGREHGIDADAMPPRPQGGLTSVPADRSLPEAYWHAAGFQLTGTRAVRIDMLERLADMIRIRVTYRSERADANASAVPAEQAAEGGSDASAAAADQSADQSGDAPPQEAPAAAAPPPKVPSGAMGDGSFRTSPDLMSVVGCSGEDFASILQAMGFRRERRRLAAVPSPDGTEPVENDIATFDEIWRPAKRRDKHPPQHRQARGKPRPHGDSRPPKRQCAPKPRTEQPAKRPRVNENSPFAVLAELRNNLAARRPERT